MKVFIMVIFTEQFYRITLYITFYISIKNKGKNLYNDANMEIDKLRRQVNFRGRAEENILLKKCQIDR